MINPRGLVHVDSLIAQEIKFYNELIVAISSVKSDKKSHEESKKAMVDDLSRLEVDAITKAINNINGLETNRMAKARLKKVKPIEKSIILDCSVKEFYEQDYMKEQRNGSFEELKEKIYGKSSRNYMLLQLNDKVFSERRDKHESGKTVAPKEFKGAKVKTIRKKRKDLNQKIEQVKKKNELNDLNDLKDFIGGTGQFGAAGMVIKDKPVKKKVAKKAKKRVVKKPAKKSKNSKAIKKAVKKVVKKKTETKKKG